MACPLGSLPSGCGQRPAGLAWLALAVLAAAADQSFDGLVIHGVPHLYNSSGELREGLRPLRLLLQRPESGGVGDAMGKLVPIYELVLQAINNGSSSLPGYVVELHLTDSKCTTHDGVKAVIRILNRHPKGFFKAVFGPLCSDTTGAVNDVLQAYKLFQVAGSSRSPALPDGSRYPFLCRLSPPLSNATEGIMRLVQLFGWTRIGLLRDGRGLSDLTVISMYAHLKEQRDAFDAGHASGYPFDLDYSELNSYIIDGTTDEAAVVASIKRSKVKVLVGALYEDSGLRFFCEVYKQGYFGKQMQFILSTGWWADNWIDEQLGEQQGKTWEQSGGGCSTEQVYEAAQHMVSVSQATWVLTPGMRHEITQVELGALKQSYYDSCSAREGCHGDFAPADYDGLAALVGTFDAWLRGGGDLSDIDYEKAGPVQELYDIMLQTDFLGATGRVRFDDSLGFACERQSSLAVKQFSNLPLAAGQEGWMIRASYTATEGFGVLQQWSGYFWQDGTETYFGNGSGWASPAPGAVASFGSDARGLANALRDWKACPAGSFPSENMSVCINCLPGKFGQDGECRDCPAGTYAFKEGMALCPTCPAGRYQNETGARNCSSCLAGTISDMEKPWQCRNCSVGRVGGRDGLDVCDFCELGKYQDREGQTACISCSEELGDPELWTTGQGTLTRGECVCNKGYLRKSLFYNGSAGDECKSCPLGMQCPLAGTSEEALLLLMEGRAPMESGAAEVLLRRFPLVKEGFMTRVREPLRAFRCNDALHCPGGMPGTCAVNCDNETVACARCSDGYYRTVDGACEECQPLNAALLFVGGGLVFFAILVLATYVQSNAEIFNQQSSTMAIIIIGGMILTGMQTLAVYHNLDLKFADPIKPIARTIDGLAVKLGTLRTECLLPFTPVLQYLYNQLTPVIVAIATGFLVTWKTYYQRRTLSFRVQYANALGTMAFVSFLSLAVSILAPLNCYTHPGDNGSSVLNSPSVLCFGDDDYHYHMITIGAVMMVLEIVPFFAISCWATWKYPTWTSKMTVNAINRLRMFRWLFCRYTPEAHYYGVVFLSRSLLVSILPVLPGCREDPALQVLLMCAVLLLFALAQMLIRPWRTFVCNMLDGNLTLVLVLILICGIMATNFGATSVDTISKMSMIFLIVWMVMGVAAVVLLTFNRLRKPPITYRFFICHHKAAAGTCARLLKHRLARHPSVTPKKVFIDSDDLKDLSSLFRIVGLETQTMVVLCSRDIFTRPWCVGEMVTARTQGLKVLIVTFPDFDHPDDEWIDDYEDNVRDLSSLAHNGITLESVQETLRWMKSLPEISLAGCFSANTYRILVAKLAAEEAGEVPFTPDPIPQDRDTAIIVDHSNSEAVSTGLLLAQMSLVHFNDNLEALPYVLPRGIDLPSRTCSVLIICTIGAFQHEEFVRAVMQAGCAQMFFIPVVADERFAFPVGDALEELRPLASTVSNNPDKVLGLIAEVFQAIAVSFFPSHAGEQVLKASVAEMVMRLNARCKKSFRRRSRFTVMTQGTASQSRPITVCPDSDVASRHASAVTFLPSTATGIWAEKTMSEIPNSRQTRSETATEDRDASGMSVLDTAKQHSGRSVTVQL